MSLRAGWLFLVFAVVLLLSAVVVYLGWPLTDPCPLLDVGGPLTAGQEAELAARCAPVRPAAGWVLPVLLAVCGLLTGGLGLMRPRE